MASKTFHGARAQLFVNGEPVGIFHNVQYSFTYDTQVPFILGRSGAAEVVLTGQEPVQVTASGYRVVSAGPFKIASLSKLQDMLNAGDISLALWDRQTGKFVMKVAPAKATGFSAGVGQKQLSEVTVHFLGIRLSDEDTENAEAADAADLPVINN